MKLVHHLISKEYPTYMYDEDIVQCGMLGLCRAAEKFDENKGKFSTYATFYIRAEIQDEFRRRMKHQGVLSLDYEIDNDGERVTFGDIIAGDEDVNYIDLNIDLSKLTDRERVVAEMILTGMPLTDIGKHLGVSKQYVYSVKRKIKAMRG